ncbi:MAG: hypothetical protein ABEL97_13950 [Salinibacter sp.]
MTHCLSPQSRRLFGSTIAFLLTLLVGATLPVTPAVAQEPPDEASPSDALSAVSGQLTLSGVVGVPRGGLRRNISGPGGGLHAHIGGWVGPDRPILAGLDVGLLNYGRTTRQVPFSATIGPRVPVDVTTKNNVFQTHLTLRLQSRVGRLRPYVEGLAGFKYLFTRTTIGEDDVRENLGEEVAGSTNYDDFALSGGAGAGIDIRVVRQDNPEKPVRAVSLHLGVQYLLGQEAEYLAGGNLADENENGRLDQSELDVRRSRTTFLQPQFGVTLRFRNSDE